MPGRLVSGRALGVHVGGIVAERFETDWWVSVAPVRGILVSVIAVTVRSVKIGVDRSGRKFFESSVVVHCQHTIFEAEELIFAPWLIYWVVICDGI